MIVHLSLLLYNSVSNVLDSKRFLCWWQRPKCGTRSRVVKYIGQYQDARIISWAKSDWGGGVIGAEEGKHLLKGTEIVIDLSRPGICKTLNNFQIDRSINEEQNEDLRR